MPEKRTRALRWAGEFLREARRSESCPESMRQQANVILRHYPDALEIEFYAKSCPMPSCGQPWLAPEVKN